MAERKTILKNYCVMYDLDDVVSSDPDDFWRYRPYYSGIKLKDEECSNSIEEMFFQTCKTGLIQATSISEAEIKMMEWINRKIIGNEPVSEEAYDYDTWNGFCIFMNIGCKEDWDYDYIDEYYGKYFELDHKEVLKDIMDVFYNTFYGENKEYENWKKFDKDEEEEHPLVKKFNLFNEYEKHFFQIWLHRWRFQLFYIENLITLNK